MSLYVLDGYSHVGWHHITQH